MITSKKTTKLVIPHPDEEGVTMVGVLEQVAPEGPTQGKKIALVGVRISIKIYLSVNCAIFRSYMGQWGELEVVPHADA